jgi:two-component system phosphate regulon sensor histidine kinase PhoR
MLWRFVTLVLCQVCVAALGWFVATPGDEWTMALAFALAGSFLWFVMDCMRGLRLLRWLREGAVSDLNLGNGLWGESYERVRRMLRAGSRLAVESDNRLEDFLAALQASPNGVVLLDSDARIEWFNQTAVEHFGFDAHFLKNLYLLYHLMIQHPQLIHY